MARWVEDGRTFLKEGTYGLSRLRSARAVNQIRGFKPEAGGKILVHTSMQVLLHPAERLGRALSERTGVSKRIFTKGGHRKHAIEQTKLQTLGGINPLVRARSVRLWPGSWHPRF